MSLSTNLPTPEWHPQIGWIHLDNLSADLGKHRAGLGQGRGAGIVRDKPLYCHLQPNRAKKDTDNHHRNLQIRTRSGVFVFFWQRQSYWKKTSFSTTRLPLQVVRDSFKSWRLLPLFFSRSFSFPQFHEAMKSRSNIKDSKALIFPPVLYVASNLARSGH